MAPLYLKFFLITQHTVSFRITCEITKGQETENLKRTVKAQMSGNAIPIEEHGLALNKQEFKDSLCLRYILPLPNLPSYCACGEMFTVNHALSCKKGGFIAQRLIQSEIF